MLALERDAQRDAKRDDQRVGRELEYLDTVSVVKVQDKGVF
ncbi:hypothetical protein [Thermoleptolyngbya oregonensis]|nr:hypothetical protein [Thermoleptolyngbya oregonensis]